MTKLSNRVSLIGRLGADPKHTKLENNSKVEFNLATTNQYKHNSGEKVDETQWHRIVSWGRTADIVKEYLKKGSKIAVEGKLVHRSYEDKEGNTKYVTEINMQEMMMLDSKAG